MVVDGAGPEVVEVVVDEAAVDLDRVEVDVDNVDVVERTGGFRGRVVVVVVAVRRVDGVVLAGTVVGGAVGLGVDTVVSGGTGAGRTSR